jgi:hypothetical protein
MVHGRQEPVLIDCRVQLIALRALRLCECGLDEVGGAFRREAHAKCKTI